jgi:hypothetical protein
MTAMRSWRRSAALQRKARHLFPSSRWEKWRGGLDEGVWMQQKVEAVPLCRRSVVAIALSVDTRVQRLETQPVRVKT